MKAQNTVRLRSNFLYLVLGIIIISSMAPVQAQVTRDHRNKKANNKVRDHRVNNKAIVKSQTLHFDEADAIFGTRTEIKKKYPSFKFMGKVARIKITQKLANGANPIYKTKSGNTVYATVKKGQIIEFNLKGSKLKEVKDGTSNTIAFKDNNKTCFKCTEICHDPHGIGVDTCWTTCVVVACSKTHNASIR